MNKTNKGIEKLEYEMDSVVVYTAYGPKTNYFPKNKLLVDKINEIIDFLSTNQTKANKSSRK